VRACVRACVWQTVTGDVHWRCAVRNKNSICLAMVRQSGSTIVAGTHGHCHSVGTCAADSQGNQAESHG